MNCPSNQLLQRLYDAELSAGEASQVRQHVAQCDACAAALASLSEVGEIVRRSPRPLPTLEAMRRWADSARLKHEAAVRRLSGWLTTAAAAAIVVAVSMGPKEQSTDSASLVPSPWDVAMLAPENADTPATQVAASWMAADLSAGSASWR